MFSACFFAFVVILYNTQSNYKSTGGEWNGIHCESANGQWQGAYLLGD